MAADKIPVFDMAFTKGVSDILGQTGYPGLINSEIDDLLAMVRVPARELGANKRDSLYRTLHNAQVRQECGHVLSAFIARAMAPSRYHADPNRRTEFVDQLNEFLVHYGFRIGSGGQLHRGAKAHTLTEAAELAGRLPDRATPPRHTRRTVPVLRRGVRHQVAVPCDQRSRKEHPGTRSPHFRPRRRWSRPLRRSLRHQTDATLHLDQRLRHRIRDQRASRLQACSSGSTDTSAALGRTRTGSIARSR